MYISIKNPQKISSKIYYAVLLSLFYMFLASCSGKPGYSMQTEKRPEAQKKYTSNPLNVAISKNNQYQIESNKIQDDQAIVDKIFNIITENPQFINEPDEQGDYPIHIAVRGHSAFILEILLSNGARPNQPNRSSLLPFDLLMQQNAVNYLRPEDTIKSKDKEKKAAYINMFKVLLDKGAEVYNNESKDESPVCFAIDNKQILLAELMLDRLLAVTPRLLYEKSFYEHIFISAVWVMSKEGEDLVKDMLGCLIDKLGNTNSIALLKHRKIIEEIVNERASNLIHFVTGKLNSYGKEEYFYSPLYDAVKNNGPLRVPQVYQELEKNLIYLNVPCGPEGNTPLHEAVKVWDATIISGLLASNADPTIKNINGQTPYQFASLFGQPSFSGQLSTKIIEQLKGSSNN